MENTLSTMVPDALFFLFSGVAVISAYWVISLQNPVRSALSLVICFFAAASLWILLSAEFLGLILILVYVGAVMTLFLFIVMTLSTGSPEDKNWRRLKAYLPIPVSLLITVLLLILLIYVLHHSTFGSLLTLKSTLNLNEANVDQLGKVLYTQYVLPFETTGVILLAAMIAAISVSLGDPMPRKRQNIAAQIQVRKEDRIKLIK